MFVLTYISLEEVSSYSFFFFPNRRKPYQNPNKIQLYTLGSNLKAQLAYLPKLSKTYFAEKNASCLRDDQ